MGGCWKAGHSVSYVGIIVTGDGGEDKNGWLANCRCGRWAVEAGTKTAAYEAFRAHLDEALPICKTCGEAKPLELMDEYRRNICLDCKAEMDFDARLKQYRLTRETHQQLLMKQGGKCAICGCQKTTEDGRDLYIEHDHDTLVVRGLVCCRCNAILGAYDDDPNLLRQAVEEVAQCSAGPLCCRCRQIINRVSVDAGLYLRAAEYLERNRS